MARASDRNPYDTFFRQAFSDPETSRELALNLLPRQYEPILRTGRITVEKGSLVDEALQTHPTDLLIRVEAPGTAGEAGAEGGKSGRGTGRWAATPTSPRSLLIYVLVEHKSYVDRWVTLQMLRYVLVIAQRERNKAGRDALLPQVLPVIVYHGTRRWSDPEFADLIDGARPGDRHVPHFRPFFVNLADLSRQQFHGGIRTLTGLLVLKQLKQPLSPPVARELLDVLERASADPEARELAALCFRVLLLVKEHAEVEYLKTLAREPQYHRVQENVMTYGEELIKEGVDKGELFEKRAVLTRQLERKFGLTEAERVQIEGCEDRGALDAALDELVFAETKVAVLGKLG